MTARIAVLTFILVPALAVAEGLSTRLSQVDASAFPRIGVTMGVFTEAGQPVPGLTRDDFALSEDGKGVAIVSVTVEQAPLSLALVLDSSGSMEPAMKELQGAVASFIRGLDPQDRAMLVTFDDRPRLREELTVNRKRLLDAVERMEPDGATALYDAISESIYGLRRAPGRRLAVVFTDGRDQDRSGNARQSAATPKEVALLSRRHQVPLWTIGLGRQVDRALLEKLAAATGGKSYAPEQAGELRQVFDELLTDVRLQYRVVYETPSAAADGSWRSVAVRSAARGLEGQGKIRYQAPSTPSPAAAAPAAPPAGDGPVPVARTGDSPDTGVASAGTDVRIRQGAAGDEVLVGSSIRVQDGPGGSRVDVGGISVQEAGGTATVDLGTGLVVRDHAGTGDVTVGDIRVHGSPGRNEVTVGSGIRAVTDGSESVVNVGGGLDVRTRTSGTGQSSVEVGGPGGIRVDSDTATGASEVNVGSGIRIQVPGSGGTGSGGPIRVNVGGLNLEVPGYGGSDAGDAGDDSDWGEDSDDDDF